MKTKLTLTVKKHLIEQAKLAARSQRTSVSSLVETFLGNLALEDQDTFSEKWLGAFKQPPHQRERVSALSMGSGVNLGFARR